MRESPDSIIKSSTWLPLVPPVSLPVLLWSMFEPLSTEETGFPNSIIKSDNPGCTILNESSLRLPVVPLASPLVRLWLFRGL